MITESMTDHLVVGLLINLSVNSSLNKYIIISLSLRLTLSKIQTLSAADANNEQSFLLPKYIQLFPWILS